MLAMFDTDARALVLHRTRLSHLMWRVKKQFPKMLFIGQSLLRNPADTLRYQRGHFEERLANLLQAVGLRSKPTPESELGHLAFIMQKLEEAFFAYTLKPYDGKLDLFRATTRLYFVEDQVYLGWKEYAKQGVRVHEVPGDHATLMHPPNDKALALSLQYALNNT